MFVLRFIMTCLGLVIILFFAGGTTLHASKLVDNPNYVKIYYYIIDTSENDLLEHYTIPVPQEMFHVEHLAFLIFNEVFEGTNNPNNKNMPSTQLYTPKNAKILKINFFQPLELLTLTLSKETLNYGGTYFEHMFVERLLKNASQLAGVDFLTISIEGNHELVYISSNYLSVPK